MSPRKKEERKEERKKEKKKERKKVKVTQITIAFFLTWFLSYFLAFFFSFLSKPQLILTPSEWYKPNYSVRRRIGQICRIINVQARRETAGQINRVRSIQNLYHRCKEGQLGSSAVCLALLTPVPLLVNCPLAQLWNRRNSCHRA